MHIFLAGPFNALFPEYSVAYSVVEAKVKVVGIYLLPIIHKRQSGDAHIQHAMAISILPYTR